MFDTKTTESNDEGVSPVIGVILMVAITVILAAVIGAFVLDMAGNLQQNASASVQFSETTDNKDYAADGLVDTSNTTVDELGDGSNSAEDPDGGQVTARVVSMQNADFVEIRVSEPSTTLTTSILTGTTHEGGTGSSSSPNDLAAVGNNAKITYEDSTSGTITVVGYLKGQGSVLQTYNYGG